MYTIAFDETSYFESLRNQIQQDEQYINPEELIEING